jgi:hypothetical protein
MKNGLSEQDIEFLKGENKNETTWEVLSNKKNCVVVRNPKETHFTYKAYSSDLFILILVIFEKTNAMLVYNLVFETPLRSMLHLALNLEQWDKNYLTESVLKNIDSENDIVYIQYKTPTGISYRDNCLARLKKIDTSQLILVSKSIDHDRAPLRKDFVRATTHFYGAIIEQEGENVKMFLYSKQDFGGYIPNFLINIVSKSRPKEWYLDLSKAIQKYSKSKL